MLNTTKREINMDDFINQLLQEAAVPESVDPEVRAQLVSDLESRLADMINRRLIDAMSEEDALGLEKLLDEQPDNIEAVQGYIEERLPNKDQVVAATLLEFRALYLGDKA